MYLLAQFFVPTCRLNIHQHCSAGIRDVSDVDTTIFTSCQILEEQFTFLNTAFTLLYKYTEHRKCSMNKGHMDVRQ